MTSHTGFEVFHKVAAEQLENCIEADEATQTIALLHTIAQLHVPNHAHERLRDALYHLWSTTGFQRWLYDAGEVDEEVQVVQMLIKRFGGVPPAIPESEEQEAAE